MIANRIVIETKADHCNPLLIEIDDVFDYFIVKKGTKRNTGTSVTLFLKNGINKIDLEKEAGYYARHLEVPIKVVQHTGEHLIEDKGFRIDVGALSGWQARRYGFHLIEIDDECIEGIITILVERDEKLGLKPPSTKWIHRGVIEKMREMGEKFFRSDENIFLSNQGLLVGHTNILPEWIDLDLMFVDLNLKRDALDLTVARNDVILNDKYDELTSRLEKIIISDIMKFLHMLEQKTVEASVDARAHFYELFDTFLSTYCDSYRIEKMWESEKLSEEFLRMIKTFCYFRCISNEGVDHIKYDEIAKTGKPLIILEGLRGYNEEHIKQIFHGCSGFKEDELYLLGDYPHSLFAERLFFEVSTKRMNFLKYFDMKRSHELKGVIPKTWKLVRFRNYKTSRLVEFAHYPDTILNRDNKFLDLLVRNSHIILGDKKIALEGFFRSLKIDLKSSFHKVISKQKQILRWFVDAKLIDETTMSIYILKKEDFPPHLLGM